MAHARNRLQDATTLFPGAALHRSGSLFNHARANTKFSPNALGTVKTCSTGRYSAEEARHFSFFAAPVFIRDDA